MSRVFFITKKEHLAVVAQGISEMEIPEFGIHIEIKTGKRTLRQNAAMHVYFKNLSEALNDAGLDMKRVLKPEIDIPWSAKTVKEWLWKPIQDYVMGEKSTTKLNRANVSEVYEVLTRHMAEKFGLSVPFPQNRYPEE